MATRTLPLLEVVGEGWSRLKCPISELRLDIVLKCGQSFRWRLISPGVWASVLYDDVWILSQNDTEILYKVYSSSDSDAATAKSKTKQREAQLRDYFQLDLCSLSEMYANWRLNDPYFDACCDQFKGVRTLRQHPVENLFSFICSSNNNIARISSMVENLCLHFGRDCGVIIDGEQKEKFFAFPCVESLTATHVEDKLRSLGFGYRAKFITSSARSIVDKGGEDWLLSLRGESYKDAKAALMSLCGVGAKVADCVCLMSLDKNGAVPVDTHVLQIVKRYRQKKVKGQPHQREDAPVEPTDKGKSGEKRKSKDNGTSDSVDLELLMASRKSLTPCVYDAIGDYFRSIWGADFAGWAQSVVFAADLKSFSKVDATKLNEPDCGSKKKKRANCH